MNYPTKLSEALDYYLDILKRWKQDKAVTDEMLKEAEEKYLDELKRSLFHQ